MGKNLYALRGYNFLVLKSPKPYTLKVRALGGDPLGQHFSAVITKNDKVVSSFSKCKGDLLSSLKENDYYTISCEKRDSSLSISGFLSNKKSFTGFWTKSDGTSLTLTKTIEN